MHPGSVPISPRAACSSVEMQKMEKIIVINETIESFEILEELREHANMLDRVLKMDRMFAFQRAQSEHAARVEEYARQDRLVAWKTAEMQVEREREIKRRRTWYEAQEAEFMNFVTSIARDQLTSSVTPPADLEAKREKARERARRYRAKKKSDLEWTQKMARLNTLKAQLRIELPDADEETIDEGAWRALRDLEVL